MLAFAPMKDAHVVGSGRKTYSSGHPMAPAYDCNIALVGVVLSEVKKRGKEVELAFCGL